MLDARAGSTSALTDRVLFNTFLHVAAYCENKLARNVQETDHERGVEDKLDVAECQ